jgi:hypothetical protein
MARLRFTQNSWAISACADTCIDIVLQRAFGRASACDEVKPFDQGLVECSADFVGPHHGNAGDPQVIRATSRL